MATKVGGSALPPEALSLIAANNNLAISVYKLIAKEGNNAFFSPFSLTTTLAMIYHGARGETADEMRNALGYELANVSDEDLASFQLLISSLVHKPDRYVLACANSMLYQKEFTIKEAYKADLQEIFSALCLEVDFNNGPDKVVNEINAWVKEKTYGMITSLLDSLETSSVMVVLNAIYFKGTWMCQFEKRSTILQTFYNKGVVKDNAKKVLTMHMKDNVYFAENESFKALQLPYKGENVAMLLLLPDSTDGLRELEDGLKPSFIQDLKPKMRKAKVEVSLPKFSLEYSKSLTKIYQRLGVNRLFEKGADLGGMSESKKLKVTEIYHKAVIEVDEKGTRAASTTTVVTRKVSLKINPKFIADHPFLFVIYDTRYDLILFMGRIDEL